MAFDMFLKITGIDGDSTDAKHPKWIECVSYNHQISQPIGGAVSAQGVITGGRADHRDFTITKHLDSASPNLALYCCNGKHITEITFELCRAMGEKTTFMIYKFADSILSSVGPSGSSSGEEPLPFEEVTIRYGEIRWEYTPTDPTGGASTQAAIKQGWSAIKNEAVT